MEEENKINEIKLSLKIDSYKEKNNNFYKKKNAGFNLVSLKARQRLNYFKQILSKYDYKDYIRKCKNMYSISSFMNNHYSMSDLYLSERKNMPNIMNLFNKLDSKINPQKIKLKTNRINNKNNFSRKENKSFSQIKTNIMDNNISNNESLKLNNKLNLSEDNRNIYKRKNIKNKTINYNIQKFNFFNFNKRINIKRKSYNGINIKNFMNISTNNYKNITHDNNILKHYKKIITNDNNYKKITIDNNIINNNIKILSYNDKKSLNSKNIILKILQNDRSLNNISSRPLLPKYKIKQYNSKKNNKIIQEILKKPYSHDNNDIKNKNIFKFPLSSRDKDISFTHYGAIIYNNSIFRNIRIENFLSNYYKLPLIYKNNYKTIKNKSITKTK